MIIDLMTAAGTDLDAAGEVHKKPRRNSESDGAYRARLIDETPADGGAAFGEFKQAGDASIKTGGISVRDYFAAKAMQGMLACPSLMASDEFMIARDAYTMADAMLAERAK